MQPDFTLNPQSCPYAKPAPKSPFFRCVSSVLSPVLVANLNWQSVSTDSSLDEPHTPSCRVNLGPVWPSSSHQSSAALAAFRYSRLDSNADVRNAQLELVLERQPCDQSRLRASVQEVAPDCVRMYRRYVYGA